MTFREDFFKPYSIVTTSLAVVSIILAVVFYYNGKKYREISYQINEPIAKIFDSKNSTPVLKLIERDSVPVSGNVYLLTGTIWNSGNLPISKEDIRQIITLKLNNSERILDFKLVKQFEPSIPKFTLLKQTENSLNLDWKYFDPAYGFNFQIMYVGREDPGFMLTGKILDVKSFTKGTYSQKESEKNKWYSFIAIILHLVVFCAVLVRYRKVYADKSFKLNIISLIFFIIVLLVDIYLIVHIFLYGTLR